MSDNKDNKNEAPKRKPKAIILDDGSSSANATGGTGGTGETKAKQPNGQQTNSQRSPRASTDLAKVSLIDNDMANGIDEELTPPPLDRETKKRFSWSTVFVAALGGLVSLAIALWVDELVRALFARNSWLGYVAVGLTALVALALLAIVFREFLGLLRIRKINHLRDAFEEALNSSTLKQTRKLVMEVDNLCEKLPQTAKGRNELKQNANAVMDPADLIALTETALMSPLDQEARTKILNSAKRVSIVTAISPRALVDIFYVLMENFRLIRMLSELYGGRPGTYGLLRLARMIITHLAATGAIAVGDGLLQQFIGHGLAAKLSSRLGEGVINGLLTARIGISAMDICRPMPFHAAGRPGISDFLQELANFSSADSKK